MHNRGIVVEAIVLPTAALKSISEISVPIVDSAVEANVRSPISGVPQEGAAAPTPISWRPQISRLRRQHPRARHPVVAVIVVVRPKSWRPDISFAGANRLFINWDCRRAEAYGNGHLCRRSLR